MYNTSTSSGDGGQDTNTRSTGWSTLYYVRTTYEPDAFVNVFGPVLFTKYRDQIAVASAAKTKPQKNKQSTTSINWYSFQPSLTR